jgi:hypothetical protein
VPLLLEAPSIYGQWLEAARDYPRTGLVMNASLIGAAVRLGIEPIGYALAASLIAAAAALVRVTRPSARDASAVAILVALLVGPLTWTGYLLFGLPLLLSRRWRGWELAAAATFSVPTWLTLALDDQLGWLPWAEVQTFGLVVLLGLVVRDVMSREAVTPRGMAVAA